MIAPHTQRERERERERVFSLLGIWEMGNRRMEKILEGKSSFIVVHALPLRCLPITVI